MAIMGCERYRSFGPMGPMIFKKSRVTGCGPIPMTDPYVCHINGVPFTITIPQMLAYIPYIRILWDTEQIGWNAESSHRQIYWVKYAGNPLKKYLEMMDCCYNEFKNIQTANGGAVWKRVHMFMYTWVCLKAVKLSPHYGHGHVDR